MGAGALPVWEGHKHGGRSSPWQHPGSKNTAVKLALVGAALCLLWVGLHAGSARQLLQPASVRANPPTAAPGQQHPYGPQGTVHQLYWKELNETAAPAGATAARACLIQAFGQGPPRERKVFSQVGEDGVLETIYDCINTTDK